MKKIFGLLPRSSKVTDKRIRRPPTVPHHTTPNQLDSSLGYVLSCLQPRNGLGADPEQGKDSHAPRIAWVFGKIRRRQAPQFKLPKRDCDPAQAS